ncbi:IS200/IS605 family accessory protein TnpB-related protein [Bacillus pacificus]|uniref:IS200/IS605 family accessory protein TnpB-related protein n=1 Tax=Bacillus pacificus TaxID=2026187 RepID=UPI0021CE6A40|nr:IS200/IS605 family accessory protein TnpB-related protein [Bacillus pacificus]MCU5374679.1 IS200/IS605 family accessory protein TnpB-related protein [Bacillus pacificus]
MKTTIPACLYDLSAQEQFIIDTESYKYSFMIRYAYKRLQEGMTVGSLEKILSAKTNANIRVAKDAVAEAVQLIKSRKALMIDYFELWKSRFEKTSTKLEKLLCIPDINPNSKRILGLQNKIEKQILKMDRYEQHIKHDTYDEVIFGGRKNFEKRTKGLLTKEQWYELRNGRFSARGDKSKKGNPNLRVIEEDGSFFLEMTTSDPFQKGKKILYQKVRFPLYIASKQSKKTGQYNGRNYPALMRQALASGDAYAVEILKRNGKYRVHISITEQPAPLVTFPVNGYCGLDTNPDGLAICHVKKDGNPNSFEWIGDGGLQDYPSDKRENLIYELCHKLVKKCVEDGTGLIVEDLKFIQDKSISAKFRRMSHSFCYRKILSTLERLCKRYGVEFIKVKPAFTSVSGRLKYQQKYRISVHESAALTIGRRGMGLKERIPKKLKDILTKQQKKSWKKQNEWARWSTVQKRITNALKKRKAKFYQWFHHKQHVYQMIKK